MTWEAALICTALLPDVLLARRKYGNADSRVAVLVLPRWIARVLGRAG